MRLPCDSAHQSVALVDRGSRPETISLLRVEDLPEDTLERFSCLFSMREKWTEEDIVPYIQLVTSCIHVALASHMSAILSVPLTITNATSFLYLPAFSLVCISPKGISVVKSKRLELFSQSMHARPCRTGGRCTIPDGPWLLEPLVPFVLFVNKMFTALKMFVVEWCF